MPKAGLEIQIPLEDEDIGESKLFTYHHPHFFSSSHIGSLPLQARSSLNDRSDSDPPDRRFSVTPSSFSISCKKSLGQTSQAFASVPFLPARGLFRSQTLPRSNATPTENKLWKMQKDLDSLGLRPEIVQKLRRWIIGIAIVDFDLDDGPVISGVLPYVDLHPAESENIAFSAFPDCLQFDTGSSCHSFTVREQVGYSSPSGFRPGNNDGYFYGYSHFTQRRDPTSKRGYEQSSVIILTNHQYPALFSRLLSIFGPLYKQHGLPLLLEACQNFATWLDPSPDVSLGLIFLGTTIEVRIPRTVDEPQFPPLSSFNGPSSKWHILASAPPSVPPPLLLFEASLTHLWSLWECLVLGEPLLVFGSSPTQTSQAVWWLRDLLKPIPLAGDIRPFFTMQDKDYPILVNRFPPNKGLILGVTNPFFEKSCSHWPHILSLGKKRASSGKPTSPGQCPAGPAPGWSTKTHKRYISKDKSLLNQVEHAFLNDDHSKTDASLALRLHFSSRTTELLVPLSRYLNTLIPSPSELVKLQTPRLKPFNNNHFFTLLKSHGCTLPFRSAGRRTDFYERWLKTRGFGLWLAQQERIVEGVLKDKRVT